MSEEDNGVRTELPKPQPPTENENQQVKDKKKQVGSNLDTTTAMGSALEPEIDQTLVGEDAQLEEENIKDTMNKRITELETKLKQTNEYYDKLCQEVVTARSLYEREREECEDVVSVAKRNIEGQVARILKMQQEKRDIAQRIAQEKGRIRRDEDETRVSLKSEEENLTRNIVILQTRLLINEGIKFERDQLLSKIRVLEVDLVEKEKHYQEQLRRAKSQIQEKYDRLYQIANEHKGSISEHVKNLSLRQQIAALKQAQEQIVHTQTTYKRASKDLLRMIDKNKTTNQKNHSLEVELAVQKSLISATAAVAEEPQKEQEVDSVTEQKESKDFKEATKNLNDLKQKIEEFKLKFYKNLDEENELNEILEDQRSYLSVMKSQKEQLHSLEQRLIPLSDVAEYIAKKGAAELKEDCEDPAIRYDMFQKLSAIITESEELQKVLHSQIEKPETPQSDIVSTPSPFDEISLKNEQRKSSHGKFMKFSPFTRQLDHVEKKILSELGLLGKYGTKQKTFACF